MSLSIVVEDGTGLANASSYASVAAVQNYAAMRGVVLPALNDTLITLMIQAMDYLESMSQDYIGQPTTTTQALSWPRSPTIENTDLSGYPLEFGFGYGFGYGSIMPSDNETVIVPNIVPTAIINAQCALTLIVNSGVVLMPNQSGSFLTVDKTGPLEQRFSERLSTGLPSFPLVEKMLSPYMSLEKGFTLRVVRA